jgi:hypothetical protein
LIILSLEQLYTFSFISFPERLASPLLTYENKVMETAALLLTSLLSSGPTTAAQPQTSEQPSGEFAKVLSDQTSPEKDGKGRIPNRQEQKEDSLPTTGGEVWNFAG